MASRSIGTTQRADRTATRYAPASSSSPACRPPWSSPPELMCSATRARSTPTSSAKLASCHRRPLRGHGASHGWTPGSRWAANRRHKDRHDRDRSVTDRGRAGALPPSPTCGFPTIFNPAAPVPITRTLATLLRNDEPGMLYGRGLRVWHAADPPNIHSLQHAPATRPPRLQPAEPRSK